MCRRTRIFKRTPTRKGSVFYRRPCTCTQIRRNFPVISSLYEILHLHAAIVPQCSTAPLVYPVRKHSECRSIPFDWNVSWFCRHRHIWTFVQVIISPQPVVTVHSHHSNSNPSFHVDIFRPHVYTFSGSGLQLVLTAMTRTRKYHERVQFLFSQSQFSNFFTQVLIKVWNARRSFLTPSWHKLPPQVKSRTNPS